MDNVKDKKYMKKQKNILHYGKKYDKIAVL